MSFVNNIKRSRTNIALEFILWAFLFLFFPTGATFAETHFEIDGLYVHDSEPENSTLLEYPSLVDGDTDTSTGINIGGPNNINQNIGLDFKRNVVVNRFSIYTTHPGNNFVNLYMWSFFISDNNINWRHISTVLGDFNAKQKRFTWYLTVTTRFLKIVNILNYHLDHYVTEIEVGFTEPVIIPSPVNWMYEIPDSQKSEEICDIEISFNDQYIIMSYRSNDTDKSGLYLFDSKSSNYLWRHSGAVRDASISDDGKYIVASIRRGWNFDIEYVVSLFNKESNIPLWEFPTQGFCKLKISGDGEYIIAGETSGASSERRKAYLFHVSNNLPLWEFNDTGPIRTLDITKNGNHAFIASSDLSNPKKEAMHLFSINSGTPKWSYLVSGGPLFPSITDDGTRLIWPTGGSPGRRYVYFFSNFSGIPDSVLELNAHYSMSGDGKYYASMIWPEPGDFNGLKLFNSNNDLLWEYEFEDKPSFYSPRISKDGHFIASIIGKNLYLFIMESNLPRWIYPGDFNYRDKIAFSGNGELLVATERSKFSVFNANYSVPHEVWVDDNYCESCDNDGHKWGVDAFSDIQNGIDVLLSGGTVHVKSGTYYGSVQSKIYQGTDHSASCFFIFSDNTNLIGENSKTTIIDGDFDGNRIYIYGNNCVVSGFTVRNSGPLYSGIEIGGWDRKGTIIKNNRITGNEFGIRMGRSKDILISNNIIENNDVGLRIWESSNIMILNDTICKNGRGISIDHSNPTISNCIIWYNIDNDIHAPYAEYLVTNSNIQRSESGTGNISEFPMFFDPNGDFHLLPYSKCIDKGSNKHLETIFYDFDNQDRIKDGDDNNVAIVDMGAYEMDPRMWLVDPLALEFGNEWVYEVTANSQKYTAEVRISTLDDETFAPLITYVVEKIENGSVVEKMWYYKDSGEMKLIGFEDVKEGIVYKFTSGLTEAWLPMEIGDSKYSSSTIVFSDIIGKTYNISLSANVIGRKSVRIDTFIFEGFEIEYELKFSGDEKSVTSKYSQIFLPYLGMVRSLYDSSEEALSSFSLNGGNLTLSSDSDSDGLKDIVELIELKTKRKLADTDGDGCYDFAEFIKGTDPLSADLNYGDINLDCSVDLKDVLLGLKLLSASCVSARINLGDDANNDGKIGFEEVIHALRIISEIRSD